VTAVNNREENTPKGPEGTASEARGGSRPSARGPNDITGVWWRSPQWGSRGKAPGEGEVPLKLTTFSYFRNYFLNKIITEIGKNKTNIFPPSLERGPNFMAKLDGGHGRIGPLDPPLSGATPSTRILWQQ